MGKGTETAMRGKSIGARLKTVAGELREYGPFRCYCDIGTDHAFLPILALREGLAASAVASDIREEPLARGRANAMKANLDPFPVFLQSDGFEQMDGYAFDAVSICGMGGETIAAILENGKQFVRKEDCLLFLQPMTAHDDLRAYLWNSGFSIQKETYVIERKHPYVVLTVRYTGIPESHSYTDRYLGTFRPSDDDAYIAYAAKAASQAAKRMRGNSNEEDETVLREALRLAGDPNINQ